MHKADLTPSRIAQRLRAEKVPSARGIMWSSTAVRRVLVRAGRDVAPKRRRNFIGQIRVFDRDRARQIAMDARSQGLSLRQIGRKLDAARLAPSRGGDWHAAMILRLLDPQPMEKPERPNVHVRAKQLHDQGYSIRVIGSTLWTEGYRPRNANAWHNGAVSRLLHAEAAPC